MASDGSPAAISGTSAVTISQAADTAKFQPVSGKTLPPGSKATAAAAAASIAAAGNALPQGSVTPSPTPAAAPLASRSNGTNNDGSSSANSANAKSVQTKSTAASASDSQSVVDQINKHLNSSGRADEFRVSPVSDKYIQQVNPTNGAVIAEYSVDEFPALARSIGASGLLIDDVA